MKRLILLALVLLASCACAEDYLNLEHKYETRAPVESLILADVNGDNTAEIIANTPQEGHVYAISGNGSLIWRYGVGGGIMLSGYIFDVYAADLENDGSTETLVGAWNQVYVVGTNGKTKWSNFVGSNNRVMVVYAADLNNDTKKEVIAGTEYTCNKNTLHVLSSDGGNFWRPYSTSYDYPSAVHVADIDADGNMEVIVGYVHMSINSIAKSCEAVPGAPSKIYVFNKDGVVKWTHETGGGVSFIRTSDIDDDGQLEILAGCYGHLYALDSAGNQEWGYATSGEIHDVKVVDLDNDKKKDILIASDRTYAIENSGKPKWNVKTGRSYGVHAMDLDNDSKLEVISGASKISVLDYKGKLLWESKQNDSVRSIAAGDIDKDGYMDVVVGTAGEEVRIFTTKMYVMLKTADRYYQDAEWAYENNEFETAVNYSQIARTLYRAVSNSDGASESTKLIDKVGKRIEADEYYAEAERYYKVGDYANATEYGKKAEKIYNDIDDDKLADDANFIVEAAKLRPQGDADYKLAERLYESGEYWNASSHAKKARDAYSGADDENATALADSLILRINGKLGDMLNKSITADEYYNKSQGLFAAGDLDKALEYAENAEKIYSEVKNDEALFKTQFLILQIKDRASGKGTIVLEFLIVALVVGITAYTQRDKIREKLKNREERPKGRSGLL